MQHSLTAKPIEVPEDVLAEMDTEERRQTGAGSPPPMPEAVPEEVRSELDHEKRLAGERALLQVAEGSPPVDDDS
jgi:hypothetical protein